MSTQNRPKIGVVLCSVREGRVGQSVADWVMQQVAGRDDAQYELIDVKSFELPLLTAPQHPMAMNKQYPNEQVQRWSAAVDACDGFVFVTPEYNHSVPGAAKNAVDWLGGEWVGKTIGFVGYGSAGGVRAVEHWRQVAANFQMLDVRQQLEISMFGEISDGVATPNERRAGELDTLLGQLVSLTSKVRG